MKIFVGTMYSLEGDFERCCDSIKAQKHVTVEHFVISNLPEKTAHNILWKTFQERRSEFDAIVKVDADTVLAHNEVLWRLASLICGDVTGVQAPLFDYFTDGFINGLNCFGPTVIFNQSTDDLFCDRNIDVNHNIVISSENVPSFLKPAGLHCHHSTDVQAFHFGLHRALKNQQHILDKVRTAWNKNQDCIRAYALLGAMHKNEFVGQSNFNYNDDQFKLAFDVCVAKGDPNKLLRDCLNMIDNQVKL